MCINSSKYVLFLVSITNVKILLQVIVFQMKELGMGFYLSQKPITIEIKILHVEVFC